jgi:hypothetical protein
MTDKQMPNPKDPTQWKIMDIRDYRALPGLSDAESLAREWLDYPNLPLERKRQIEKEICGSEFYNVSAWMAALEIVFVLLEQGNVVSASAIIQSVILDMAPDAEAEDTD